MDESSCSLLVLGFSSSPGKVFCMFIHQRQLLCTCLLSSRAATSSLQVCSLFLSPQTLEHTEVTPFLFFSFLFFFNWSLIYLQGCVSFRYTAKWFRFVVFVVCLFRGAPAAYRSSQARGRIGATSATYTKAQSNVGSLSHWARPGIEPMSSWILVEVVTTEPWQELQFSFVYSFFFRFFPRLLQDIE